MQTVVQDLDEFDILATGKDDDEEQDGFGGALGDAALGDLGDEAQDSDDTGPNNESDEEAELPLHPRSSTGTTAVPSRKCHRVQGSWKHPEWLEAAYEDKIAWLRSTMTDGSALTALHRRPSSGPTSTLSLRDPTRLALGTFVLPHVDNYFQLANHDSSKLYNPRWFFWTRSSSLTRSTARRAWRPASQPGKTRGSRQTCSPPVPGEQSTLARSGTSSGSVTAVRRAAAPTASRHGTPPFCVNFHGRSRPRFRSDSLIAVVCPR